ncbi:MAG: peptidoglycan-binding protein [Solirubrobacterales bacterium]|nr:peptidoglycan-binding protein [Solirubrobacterales bacterium]
MTQTFSRRLGLIALLLPVLFVTLYSAPQKAEAASPFNKAAMWIWYVDDSNGGNLRSIIRQSRQANIGTLFIKSGDGDETWSQFNKPMVRRLQAAGLNVCGWQYTYGRRPIAEARVAAVAKRRGADCFVINAEAEYEGKYAAADWYIRELRRRVGPRFPIGLSSFPYVHYHPAFPYSVFLGPGAANVNLPQVYWHTIGDPVRTSLEITWEQNSIYKRPIRATGQTWDGPPKRDLLAFRRFMINYGSAASWWSWQETDSSEWAALGKKVARVPGYRAFSGKVALETGSRGDQVVWLQQHLIALGYAMQPTGIFNRTTARAVRRFQRSRGLAVDGQVGTQTWNRLMRVRPVRVRWSAAGSKNRIASASSATPAAPLSADLPAVRNEIAGAEK